jgi:hypothetical protein
MLRSKKVIQPSHSQAKSKISNNAKQTPEAWLAVNYWKDLDWKKHETENPEDEKNWKKGIPVPLDYTDEQLANSDGSWEACADVSYAYCNEEPVTEENRRMKACAEDLRKIKGDTFTD